MSISPPVFSRTTALLLAFTLAACAPAADDSAEAPAAEATSSASAAPGGSGAFACVDEVTMPVLGEIGIAVGETPTFPAIEDLEGNLVCLADFVGERPVLFEFWATWCEDCAHLHPYVAEAYAAYSDQIEFVAVGVGVNQTVRRIVRHLDEMDPPVTWPTFYDGGGKAVRAFAAPNTSFIAIVDAEGQVVYAGTGPDQDIDAIVREAIGQP